MLTQDDCNGLDGMYEFNELACKCFSMIKCMLYCGPGQELHPEQGCNCVDYDVIRDLFPEGTTD